MIQEPNQVLTAIWVIIPMLAGMTVYFIFSEKNRFPESLLIGTLVIGMALSFSGAIVTISWDNEYKTKVSELIDSSKCSDLPMLAITYSRFEDKIVKKLVLECITDPNFPEIAEFVKENFYGT